MNIVYLSGRGFYFLVFCLHYIVCCVDRVCCVDSA